MKHRLPALLVILVFFSCKNDESRKKIKVFDTDLSHQKSFGNEIFSDNAIAIDSLSSHYKRLKIGDSIPSKIIGKVNEVCKAKGCWMKLAMNDDEVMVKFKNYGFFVPRNIKGKEVIVNGKGYVKEISVKEQRHYAKDAGKSEVELAAIKTPKRTYLFEADGVLLK